MAGNLPQLGPYRLVREIGRGSNGVVYEAQHESGVARAFAVKVLLGWDADEEDLARFHLEAQVAAKLEDPGVVGVLDVGQHGEHHWYAMELCRGPTLRDRLRESGGSLPWREAAELVAQVARSMAAAHALGIVHRDLKPANIILDAEREGLPRITDFGMARDRSLARSLTRTGTMMGTPLFMAPEQARDAKAVSPAADVYSLGVILYHAVTGQYPVPASTPAELCAKLPHYVPQPPSAYVKGLPAIVEHACLKALEKDPADRFSTAAALAAELEDALREGGEAARPEPSPKQKEQVRWKPVAVIGAVALLVPIVAVLAWPGGDGDSAPPDPPQTTGPPTPPPPAKADRAEVELYVARMGRAAREDEIAWARAVADAREIAVGELTEEVEQAAATQGEDLLSRLEVEADRATPLDPRLVERLKAVEGALPADTPVAARARFTRLQLLWRRARYVVALDLARSLGEHDLYGLRARHLEARCLLKLGHEREAWTVYRDVWRADPDGAVGVTALAELWILAKDTARGRKAASRALTLGDYVPARVVAARTTTGGKRALQLLEGVDDPDAQRIRVRTAVLKNARRFPSLFQEARRLVSDHDPDLLSLGAQVYLQSKAGRKSEEVLDLILKRYPDRHADRLMRAIVRQGLGDREGRLADLREAQRGDPSRFEGYLQEIYYPEQRAQIRRELGLSEWAHWRQPEAVPPEPEGFARIERRVTRVAPAARDSLRQALWTAAEGWEGWDAVAPHLERATLAAPDDAQLAFESARLAVARDRLDAEAFIARARELGADDTELRFLSGTALARQGRELEARSILSTLPPESHLGRVAQGQMLLLQDKVQEARPLLQGVLRDRPDDPRVLTLLALVSVRTDAQDALVKAERAVALLGSQDARALTAMSIAEEATGAQGTLKGERGAWALVRRHQRQACAIGSNAYGLLSLAQMNIWLTLNSGSSRQANMYLQRARGQVQAALQVQPERLECHMLWALFQPSVAKARAVWTEVTARDPNARMPSELAQLLLRRLGKDDPTVRQLVDEMD